MMIYIPQDVLPMTGDPWASISEEAKDFISNCLTVDVLQRATLAKCVNVLQCGIVGCSVVHFVAVCCYSLFGFCIARLSTCCGGPHLEKCVCVLQYVSV